MSTQTNRTLSAIGSRVAPLVTLSLFLAACEDRGNPGDDNLLTGASLVVILLIAGVIALRVARRRRG